MDGQEQEAFTIRLFEDGGDEATIHAGVLVQVLEGLQKATYLVGMEEMGVEFGRRAHVPPHVRKAFAIRCSLPEQGSYALPVQLGDVRQNLFAPTRVGDVANRLEEALAAVGKGLTDQLSKIGSCQRYRTRVLDAIRSMLPKAGTTWRLCLKRKKTGGEYFLNCSHRAVISEAVAHRPPEEFVQTVTGYLHKMDFDERRIVILHPGTNRELACTYDESLEFELVESRRDLVQVTGTVVNNSDGVIEKIIDVEDITPLDCSEFVIHEVDCGAKVLRFKQPLELTPEPSESKQLLFLEKPDLGISVYGQTRDELLAEINEQIVVLWNEYAREDDDKLTDSALELKNALLAMIEEAKND